MKLLTLMISLIVLSSCATIRRYNVGDNVSYKGCSSTIEQILSSTGYRVSGCGSSSEAHYSELNKIND